MLLCFGRDLSMMFRMQNNINRLLWCVVLAGLLLCGCAADKAYDEGIRLLERGNYDSAVSKLKKSVRLAEGDKFVNDLEEPCCGREYTLPGEKKPEPVEEKKQWPWEGKNKLSKYRLKLKEAKQRGAKYHYKEARRNLDRADLSGAKAHLDMALEYDQSVFEYHDLLKIVTATTEKAEEMRTEALDLAKSKNWPEAVDRMVQALAVFRTMPNGKQTLDKIKRDAYDYHYQLAYDFLSKDDRTAASDQAKKALVYVPNGHAAQNILTKIANRNKADGLVAAAEKLLATGQCEQALETLQYAYKLYPSMPNIMTLIRNAKMSVCDKKIASGNRYFQSGRYEQALRVFRSSDRILSGYKNVNLLIEKTCYELAGAHDKKADDFTRRQLFGNAILHDVLIQGYRSDNYAVKQRLLENKKKIQKDIKYVMGFLGFDSSAKNHDLAKTLEAVAVQHLSRVKPPNVMFMERMDLNKVMDELNFNITDMVDPEFRIERGKLKGVDALVVGQILENKVLSTSKTTYGNTKYQSGTKMVSNPEYPPAEREYKSAIYELERAHNKLAAVRRHARHIISSGEEEHSVGEQIAAEAAVSKAQKDVNRAESRSRIAQNRLNMTPRQVSVPRILPHTYPIQHITKTAKVGLFIKVLDTMTGSILFSDRVVGKYEESDKYVEGDSVRNVVADPLNLPSDTAMLDKATVQLIANMNNSLELASKKHGQRFVSNMRIAEKIGDSERAVENCIRYLFAYPVGSDHTNKMTSYLESLISAEKDLIDLDRLLQKHCHVLLRQAEFPANMRDSNDRVLITRLNTRVAERIKLPCTLIAIEGRPINSVKEVDAVMTQYGVGDRISITVMSNNRNVSTEIELARARN